MKVSLPIIICMILILSISSNTYSDDILKCGDEYRFISVDSISYQGKLNYSGVDSLILQDGTLLYLNDLNNIYHVKRHTFYGILIGSAIGTGIGLLIAHQQKSKEDSNKGFADFGGISEKIVGGVIITLFGTLIGGSIGGVTGYNIKTLKEVKFELLPSCSSFENYNPINLRLTYNF